MGVLVPSLHRESTSSLIFVQDKWTPLMIASHNGHVEVVNILLQNGAHLDVQNEVSLTFYIGS